MIQIKKDPPEKSSDSPSSDSPFDEPVVVPDRGTLSTFIRSRRKIFPGIVESTSNNAFVTTLRDRLIHGAAEVSSDGSFAHSWRNTVDLIVQRRAFRSRRLGGYGRALEEESRVKDLALGFDEIIDGDQDADGDKAVGEIECGPVKVRPVDVEKINHFAYAIRSIGTNAPPRIKRVP